MVVLQLDGGEGRNYNETFLMAGPQWLQIDKQEGVYAGGRAEYTGIRTFEVLADFHSGKYLYLCCTNFEMLFNLRVFPIEFHYLLHIGSVSPYME